MTFEITNSFMKCWFGFLCFHTVQVSLPLHKLDYHFILPHKKIIYHFMFLTEVKKAMFKKKKKVKQKTDQSHQHQCVFSYRTVNFYAMGRDTFYQIRLSKILSNLALNFSGDGVSAASVDNLCHCFTTLIVKNFFLINNLNLLFRKKILDFLLLENRYPLSYHSTP